ncbi:MAG TPA: hypothetical protein VMH01_06645 [Puia sp.]|nr:hypothetical protein [Puia sp.]
MKFLLVIVFFGISALSCTKKSVEMASASNSIQGKWNILVDSFYTLVGAANHLVVYSGMAGDYYDFSANGILIIKEEWATTDTTTYKLVSSDQIIIPVFGLTGNGVLPVSTIDSLSSHELIITSPFSLTPGGLFWRKAILYR